MPVCAHTATVSKLPLIVTCHTIVVVQVFTWSSPSVSMMIGVIPFTMHIDTPITMGMSGSVSSEATVSASLYATAQLKAGYKYDVSSNPNLQQISENSFTYGGSGLSVDSLCSGTASASVSIMPVAQVVVSFVGGPVS